MRLKSIIQATLAVAAAGALPGVWQSAAVAQVSDQLATSQASFTVGDIRIEGLQRISEGTVYNYLPVNIGDQIDQRRIAEALRAMYNTGFFRDVEIRREAIDWTLFVREVVNMRTDVVFMDPSGGNSTSIGTVTHLRADRPRVRCLFATPCGVAVSSAAPARKFRTPFPVPSSSRARSLRRPASSPM